MIILDTNIISEITKPLTDKAVTGWFFGEDRSDFHLCSIGVMEQSYGTERVRLKTGSDRYLRAIAELLNGEFRSRIVDWDTDAAILTGHIRTKREALGATDLRSGRHDRRHLPLKRRYFGDAQHKRLRGA